MTEATPDRGGLEILDKADAVLRVLASRGEVSAAAISELVDEPTSSTYRLLTNLVALDFVEPGSRRGLFRLAVDVLRVGNLVEDRLDVRDAAGPHLRQLLAQTGATSFLCIRADDRAVCVERFEGRDVRSLALALGQSLPLHHGAAPRAILSFLPPSERSALVDRLLATDPSPPSRAEVEDMIGSTRARGYAISDGDVTPGIAALGAPIFNHRGEVAAALSISGLRAQVLDTSPDPSSLVLAAASATSAALGHPGGSH